MSGESNEDMENCKTTGDAEGGCQGGNSSAKSGEMSNRGLV